MIILKSFKSKVELGAYIIVYGGNLFLDETRGMFYLIKESK